MNTSTPVVSPTAKGPLCRVDSSAGVKGEAGVAHMCDVCGRTFAEPACLALHYRQIHAGERPFECEVCGNSFTLKRSLVVHRQMHAGEKPYVCSVCNKGFACKNRLKVHSRIHTGEKPFACDLCNQMFAYKYLVKRHHQMVHLGERQFFKCPVCTADFTYKRTLNVHIKMHQLSQLASSQQDSVAAVISSSTSNSSITSNSCDIGDGMVNCITVGYLNSSTHQQPQGNGQLSFGSDFLLPHNNLQKSQRCTTEKTHRQPPRVHGGERPFVCEVCGNDFADRSSLVVHRKIHTREKPYKCLKCNEEFESSAKLQRHMLVHTEEQPHRCTVCGKSFIQSLQLVLHMRSHTGEKPYFCSVCCKGFASTRRLKAHSRIHSRERPFACDFCDKTFAYKQGLKLHLVVHFGGRLHTSKKALDEYFKEHGLSGTSKQSTLSQQQDSGAAVVSSSSLISSNTRNPCDVSNDMLNRIIVKCLNSSPSRQSERLPHDLQNNSRYTTEQNHRQQLFASMLFGCSTAVNQTNTDGTKELVFHNNVQVSQEQKQQQSCFTNKNYSEVHHHDFDSMDFRHIPPLIPI